MTGGYPGRVPGQGTPLVLGPTGPRTRSTGGTEYRGTGTHDRGRAPEVMGTPAAAGVHYVLNRGLMVPAGGQKRPSRHERVPG